MAKGERGRAQETAEVLAIGQGLQADAGAQAQAAVRERLDAIQAQGEQVHQALDGGRPLRHEAAAAAQHRPALVRAA